MKRFIFVILALVLLVAPCGAQELRVGTECDYPPDNWSTTEAHELSVPIKNQPGAYADGNDIQIARIIADRLGAELAIIKVPWENLIDALNNNEIDLIIASMSDTSERWELINFSRPYKATTCGLLVKAGSPYVNATSMQDFIGANILVDTPHA